MMWKYLILLLNLSACAFAEILGRVEYQLPLSAKDWEVTSRVENEKGSAIIYVPRGSKKGDASEFFGIVSNTLPPTDLSDLDSLKRVLTKMLPGKEVELIILEKRINDILYEWSAFEKEQEKIHGWGRAISVKNGTSLIGYQTDNITNIPKERLTWLPVLQKAKVHP